MIEYTVYIQTTEMYVIEADSEEEARDLASSGQAGDAWERWDDSVTVEQR
jgi:hypothetical protein